MPIYICVDVECENCRKAVHMRVEGQTASTGIVLPRHYRLPEGWTRFDDTPYCDHPACQDAMVRHMDEAKRARRRRTAYE